MGEDAQYTCEPLGDFDTCSKLWISTILMNIQGPESLKLSLTFCLYFITITFLGCLFQGNSFYVCYIQIP